MDKTAAGLQISVMKRGASNHVRECQLLINALQRVIRCASYTAETGKIHRDDTNAHAAMKRAYKRVVRFDTDG